jgi:flagellar protein FlbD
MIELTKLNGSRLVVNSDLIEFIEAAPDSLITLTTGTKIMVQEKIPDIIAAIIRFRRLILQQAETNTAGAAAPDAMTDPAKGVAHER